MWRLRDRLVTIGAGVVFLLSLLRARADRLELPPEFDVVDLGEEVVVDRLPRVLSGASQRVLVADLDHPPSDHFLIGTKWTYRRDDGVLDLLRGLH